MRVLFNTYPWAFDRPGGGEMQLMKYAEHLPRLGFEVVLHDLWRPRFDDVDLVHFFSGIGGSIHFCHHVRARGLPLLVSSSLWVTPATCERYPIAEIRAQFALAQAVVTNSQMEAEALADVLDLPREQFQPVLNGVDRRFAEPVDAGLFRARFGVDGPFVLNIANVEPRKNQLGLVRALQGAGLPLVIIGHPRDAGYLRRVMAEGGGFTRYLGPIAHDDPALGAAYAACSVFALPSELETPGLAALEAAAAGARMVVTEEGSTREYFADEVVYAKPGDIAGIRAAIERALAGPRQVALARRIAERYAWERVIGDLGNLYERVAIAPVLR
jgi:glycosyltransferase involved in cell wall biosynthesis